MCDNTSVVDMAKIPVHHNRTKHIDVPYNFTRDNVEKGVIVMKSCRTEDQIVDIFIKSLGREQLERNHLAPRLINQL